MEEKGHTRDLRVRGDTRPFWFVSGDPWKKGVIPLVDMTEIEPDPSGPS